jgi:hypothetical protein
LAEESSVEKREDGRKKGMVLTQINERKQKAKLLERR